MKLLGARRRRSARLYVYAGGALLVALAAWRTPPPLADAERIASPVDARAESSTAAAVQLSLPSRMSGEELRSDLFAAHSWYVPPPPSPARAPAPVQPSAPPLPYAFLGSYAPQGGRAVYFISRDDRVFDVGVGDTLENTYRVEAQANGQLYLTYLPLKVRQALVMGDPQATGSTR